MKVIIPVAGYGTRLRPHTLTIQKTLLPVAGKPTLDLILEPLISQGIIDITLITGHFGEQVKEHVKALPGNYRFVDQTERLGLGHAVYQGLEDRDEPLIIQLGDTIFRAEYAELLSVNHSTIAVMPVEDPSRFGVISQEGDLITGFFEKVENPPTNLAISGLYAIRSERRLKNALETLFEKDIKTRGEFQLTDALALMLKSGEPFRYCQVPYYDVGVPETFLETNRALLSSNHSTYPGVEFKEPVYVGNHCQIENSTLGPAVTIMEHCIIRNCTIQNSIVLAGSVLENQTIDGKIVAGDGSQFC
ncbi:MAG: NTP transferase domain-containing protein [FCB group bacterium]|nr:NTP transferase domain-containing protein [FCB group bacterium]